MEIINFRTAINCNKKIFVEAQKPREQMRTKMIDLHVL